jgi:hypothetical protein
VLCELDTFTNDFGVRECVDGSLGSVKENEVRVAVVIGVGLQRVVEVAHEVEVTGVGLKPFATAQNGAIKGDARVPFDPDKLRRVVAERSSFFAGDE